MKELLRMENITKRFGPVTANDSVNLSIHSGEVHTLLGENGAGKSTLMNVLIGLYQPTEGSIYLNGEKVKIDSPAVAVKYGIGMVHQHFMLVEAMTVFENIILGRTKDTSVIIKEAGIKKEIQELSDRYGLNVELNKKITDISVGAQQRVEILKTLYRGADILVLDEPSAVLTDEEVAGLFDIIHKLTHENKAVIFISHKMREVMEISDRITILRAGKSIKTLNKDETSPTELANLMIGHELVQNSYTKVVHPKAPFVMLDQVSYNPQSKHNGLKDLSLSIGKGEILGIAGVDGNGQSELAQVITGVIRPEKGSVILNNKKMENSNPIDFINAKVSHIPEDRNKMGLIGDMSIKENLVLKDTEIDKYSFKKGLKLKKKEILSHAQEMEKKYDIRCSSVEQSARSLSGGNQQKVILARELEEDPEFLVAVHPTRGLDIGATQYVHDNIIKARNQGCAVLLISADFDEILKLSDRIAVMFEGQIVHTYPGNNPPVKEISLAMSGKQ